MKCYICGEKFSCNSDCPGCCLRPECRAELDVPEKWTQFLRDKQDFIIAKIAGLPPGRPFIHQTLQKEKP